MIGYHKGPGVVGLVASQTQFRYQHILNTSRKKMSNSTSIQSNVQYSLAKILGIWIAAARTGLEVGLTRWFMIIVGLIWLFVLTLIVQYRELGTLRWPVIRKRMCYQTPIDPKTGEPNMKLLWWALPATLLNGLIVLSPIDGVLTRFVFSAIFITVAIWRFNRQEF